MYNKMHIKEYSLQLHFIISKREKGKSQMPIKWKQVKQITINPEYKTVAPPKEKIKSKFSNPKAR